MLVINQAASYAINPGMFRLKEISALGTSLVFTLTNLLYFEPATTKLMFKRHKLERELGTGHEVGKLKPDNDKARGDKQLQELSKQFGMMHGMSTIMNLAALCCGVYHMYQTIEP